MQLGTFDLGGFTPEKERGGASEKRNVSGGYHQHHQPGLIMAPPSEHVETLTWPESARHVYGRNYVNQSSSAISAGRIKGLRGSSLRDLHNAVFDVIDGSNTSPVVRVGLGASVYGFVGRWVPRTLVSYMMGIRQVDEVPSWNASSAHGSPRPGSAGSQYMGSGGGSDLGVETSQDFISIPMEHGDSQVWREAFVG
jgi:hypothetical protein